MPEPAEPTLLDLARRRLTDVADDSTLNTVMKRLFDPRERDLSTVSAFQSAL
jgi:hypothetical protein